MAKLSISIPEELRELLEERATADQVPVSHVVSEALRRYFELPSAEPQAPAATPELAKQVQDIQEYLWHLHFSHEMTRSAALNLYYWAGRQGENLGMPPEMIMPKPPWPKQR
mgnify:FL=1